MEPESEGEIYYVELFIAFDRICRVKKSLFGFIEAVSYWINIYIKPGSNILTEYVGSRNHYVVLFKQSVIGSISTYGIAQIAPFLVTFEFERPDIAKIVVICCSDRRSFYLGQYRDDIKPLDCSLQ